MGRDGRVLAERVPRSMLCTIMELLEGDNSAGVWTEWAKAGREDWGELGLRAERTAKAAAEAAGPTLYIPLTPEEEALDGYTPPSLLNGLVEPLVSEFPIRMERDGSLEAFGILRFVITWDEERLADWRNWRLDEYNSYEHYTFFKDWERLRLRKTLAAYDYKYKVEDHKGGLYTVTVLESLSPLQLLQRFPFCWDQEGGRFGIRVHRKKLQECCMLPAFRGREPLVVARMLGLQLLDLAVLRSDLEDIEVTPLDSEFLYGLSFYGFEDVCAKPTVGPAVGQSASLAPKPLVASVCAPTAATAPAPTASAVKAPVVRMRALDVLRGYPVAWKREGSHHSIEVHRGKMADYGALPANKRKSARELAREVQDALHRDLQGCADCEILPPPRGSSFFFVVRML